MRPINLYLGISLMIVSAFTFSQCSAPKEVPTSSVNKLKLVTLDPGHFHAALVQKSMYPDVDSTVHVYAPKGMEVESHLRLVENYNKASTEPTSWKNVVYTGDDFLQRMFSEKAGNVVVISGNNLKKTEYIRNAIDSGFNVLADKPLAIDAQGFELLQQAFATAQQKDLLLYDIMTERFEINSILQRELSSMPELFGTLEKGTTDDPAVVKESIHHFYKVVSGQPLVRPAWFFDTEQQGNGIVDVTTHLVDLIQWVCFPDHSLDYRKDISIINAERSATLLTPEQFSKVTKVEKFPSYLEKDIKDGKLAVYSNGRIVYQVKGVNASVAVKWNYEAPQGTGDTHFSLMKGSRSNLIIRQEKEQNFKPVLYIQPVDTTGFENVLRKSVQKLNNNYAGIDIKKVGNEWEIIVPDKFKTGHEAHFAEVMRKYIGFLRSGTMPAWEVPNMLAKYYTTTQALEKAIMKGTTLK